MEPRALWVGGSWETGPSVSEVRSPFDGRKVSAVCQAGAEQVERALAYAFASRGPLAAQTTGQRREVLRGIADGLARHAEELTQVICDEAGKPRALARVEVKRAVETFTLAAAEVTTGGGRTVPIDLDAGSAGLECEVRRFPAGVVVGIVPFNFPLNLGAHKVAPALAVGAPIVVKPPPQAPSAQLMLARLAQEAGAHPAALQVLPCDNTLAEKLATDPRVRVLSFTGSAKVGWKLKAKAPAKVVLELGGNAAAVVCADADLDWAAERCVAGGFGYAGQVCIKVQRLLVEEAVAEPFVQKLLERTRTLKPQDPALDSTVVGPVIDDAAAARIEEWLEEAVRQGARVLVGGKREGRMWEPTVVTEVPSTVRLAQEEVFGPVVVLRAVKDFEAALEAVNDSAYGLQAGVFTHDLRKARRAFHALEVGGVVVNDAPTLRSDAFPYGGVKGSGLGREGVRSAMEEFTEERVWVTRLGRPGA